MLTKQLPLSQKSRLSSQRGIATIELVPVILMFAMMFNFTLGFFGVIHSGILNSIAARNYTFETFRNRANLNYLRDIDPTSDTMKSNYSKVQYRFHGIITEGRGEELQDKWPVTRRPIKFTDLKNGVENVGSSSDHKQLVRQVADTGKVSDIFTGKTPDEGRSGVSPVWIQVLYGICLNSKCTK
ncbi:MAG: hypothetical protein ACK5P7_01600 [Bdellovibrio sp.]|jgi:hypothetical protein